MIYSMTAFSRRQVEHSWGSLIWELRSVNHRYLEPSFKLPEAARQLEMPLRDSLRRVIKRGKVECSLRLQLAPSSESSPLSVDNTLLDKLIEAAEGVQNRLTGPAPIDALQLLQWPGVVVEGETGSSDNSADLISAFNQAVEQLNDNRQREGAALVDIVTQRLDSIDAITAAVRVQLPTILAAQRLKMERRLAQFRVELDPERLEQEMVLLAQKADVDEELDRLDTHLAEVRRILTSGGSCGRQLDFLMQELNREANTLCSKSIVSETTQSAVELKVLIEQMREQIQNID